MTTREDKNRMPVTFGAERTKAGYRVRWQFYGVDGKRIRRSAYGATEPEAQRNATAAWWEAVRDVRGRLSGQIVEVQTAPTWAELVRSALPSVRLRQMPRQVATTLRYAAVWGGFCASCDSIDVEACEPSDSGLAVRRARCRRCHAALLCAQPITAITAGTVNRLLSAARGLPRRGINRTGRISDATVNRIAAAGAALLGHAVSEEWLDRAPTDRARRLTESRKVVRVMAGDQALALADCVDEAWRPAAYLMLLAGLRVGEATNLRPSDVDLERGHIVVRLGSAEDTPKSGHERLVPIVSTRLGDALAAALRERSSEPAAHVLALPDDVRRHIERSADLKSSDVAEMMGLTIHVARARLRRWVALGLLSRHGATTHPQYRIGDRARVTLASREPDRPIAGGVDPRGAIARAAKRARVAAPTRHGMRHWFCSACLALGVPVPTVREWLGHSSVAVTDVYAHSIAPTDAVRALLDRIDPFTRGGL